MKNLLYILILTTSFSSCNDSKLVDNQYQEYLIEETKLLKGETEHFISEAKRITSENLPKYKPYLNHLESIEIGMTEFRSSAENKSLEVNLEIFDFEKYMFMPTIRNHVQVFIKAVRLIDSPIDDMEQIILLNNIEKFRNAVVTNYYLKYFEDDSYFSFNKLWIEYLGTDDDNFYHFSMIGIDTTRQDIVEINGVDKKFNVNNGIVKIPAKYQNLDATYYFVKDDGKRYDYQFKIREN